MAYIRTIGLGLALAVSACLMSTKSSAVDGVTRRLNLHNVNTNEDLDITYKTGGRYDQAALAKLNWFFRDWRKNQPTRMDPKVFDLLGDIYEQTGSHEAINVHSGFRSAGTNAMLRQRTAGVSENSQHIQGKAIDFHVPGVSVATLRAIALKMQRGGVGFYPTSGSPFVHVDVAGVRYWPRASREYLASIFPDGKTVLLPKDGKPLPGYDQALAEVQGRKLGILSVIGEFVTKNTRTVAQRQADKAEEKRAAGQIALVRVPVPAARPPGVVDPVPSVSDRDYVAYREPTRRGVNTFDNPFEAILLGKQRLAEASAPANAGAQPPTEVVFRDVEIGKTGRRP
jgi:uncharacterized protein YcbK (DUF882 family)